MHGNSKYPLELKFAVCCGEELKHFSKSDIRKIPRATLSEWRKTPISKFVNQFENGAEHPTVTKYLSRQDEELERNKQAIESYMTFVRFVKDAMGVKSFTRMLGENKEKFVEVVEGLEVLEKRIYLKRLFYQTIGLPESVVSPSRQLLHTVDLYGRLVNPAQISSGIYIQWYSDGSYEKVWLDE